MRFVWYPAAADAISVCLSVCLSFCLSYYEYVWTCDLFVPSPQLTVPPHLGIVTLTLHALPHLRSVHTISCCRYSHSLRFPRRHCPFEMLINSVHCNVFRFVFSLYGTLICCRFASKNLHLLSYSCVAWWCNGQRVRLRIERSWVRLPAVPLPGNNPGQVVHTRASVTKQYDLVPA